ncbi:MAG: zinc-dependent alcohol dehydrogenase family protein [Planctomycetota bacterium]
MKAMLLRRAGPIESRPLEGVDLPIPSPGPGEIRIKVRACGVCHTDLHTVVGELDPPLKPVVPGHQIVGIVDELGPETRRFREGERVGMAWLYKTCRTCAFCRRDQENLCVDAEFTGYHAHGGYAEYTVVHEDYAYAIPELFTDEEAAPLLCAGIIGYRSLILSRARPGDRLGLYGFGAAAHIVIQIARHRGMEVFVFSRGNRHLEMARDLGAAWTGHTGEMPPAKINSSIIFAPAGSIVPEALKHLDKGGTLALGGIYMSPIPTLDYQEHLYDEKTVRSVTASTRRDGEELLKVAAEIPIRTRTQAFPLREANEALHRLKMGKINGEAVLIVDQERRA